jgi:hypothetical protein
MLPNSLTFEFEVRRQVAIFSPPLLPNLLTYRLLPVVLSVRCNTVSGHDEPPGNPRLIWGACSTRQLLTSWNHSPCASDLLELLTVARLCSLPRCRSAPGTAHLSLIGRYLLERLTSHRRDAMSPGTTHLSSRWRHLLEFLTSGCGDVISWRSSPLITMTPSPGIPHR